MPLYHRKQWKNYWGKSPICSRGISLIWTMNTKNKILFGCNSVIDFAHIQFRHLTIPKIYLLNVNIKHFPLVYLCIGYVCVYVCDNGKMNIFLFDAWIEVRIGWIYFSFSLHIIHRKWKNCKLILLIFKSD